MEKSQNVETKNTFTPYIYIYIYINIILHIVKSSSRVHKLVHEYIIMFELGSFNN